MCAWKINILKKCKKNRSSFAPNHPNPEGFGLKRQCERISSKCTSSDTFFPHIRKSCYQLQMASHMPVCHRVDRNVFGTCHNTCNRHFFFLDIWKRSQVNLKNKFSQWNFFFTVTGGSLFWRYVFGNFTIPEGTCSELGPLPPKLEKCSNKIYSAPATYSTPPGTRKP